MNKKYTNIKQISSYKGDNVLHAKSILLGNQGIRISAVSLRYFSRRLQIISPC